MTMFQRLLGLVIGLSVAAGVSGCGSDLGKCGTVHLGTGGGGGAGSGGAGGASGPDASAAPDGSRLGQSYACGGGAAAAADGAPPIECVVGQSYCKVQLLDKVAGSTPIYNCLTVSEDGGLGACATTPTCACLCAQGNGIHCETECSCSDTGGVATITCHQI